MARIDVTMPQMGESIAEGTLSKWLKKVGDKVKRDEPIFEISTDKVDAEIPSPTAGTLAEILVQEGTTVAVHTLVARIDSAAAATAPVGAAVSASAGSASAQPAAPAPVGVAAQPAAPSPSPAPVSSGGNGSVATGPETFEERLRSRSSPLVRKMAAEHGVNISALNGSGIAGRVTKRDLLDHLAAAPAPAGASMHAPSGAAEFHGPMPEPWPGDRVEPMSKMRALISEHMVASRRTSAHVTSFMEMDFTRIAKIRANRRREFEAATGEKLSYMPFIIKATVDAIKQYPIMNSSVAGTNVIYRRSINIGIAVALDWGLIVPVIKNADSLSLTGITRALNDLANRARVKKLLPQEVQEGTFSITNPGGYGSLMGTPIISQPQVAIMGVGAIEKRPKVISGADGEDTIAIRTCAYFSISFDHRIIDGAIADQFLAQIKRNIESFPETGVI